MNQPQPDIPADVLADGPKHTLALGTGASGEVAALLGRVRSVEEQLLAMQEGFNRLQALLQPALSRTGACGGGPAE